LDLLPFCFLFAGWLVCHASWVLVVLAGHTLFLISTTKVSAEICAAENIYTGWIPQNKTAAVYGTLMATNQ
jgi:hypothetical protein